MALRSAFSDLRVQLHLETTCRMRRLLCSSLRASTSTAGEELVSKTINNLKYKILRLKYPNDCATTVLQNWADQGYNLPSSELRRVSVQLLKSERYIHALQIVNWIENQSRFRMFQANHSIKMELIIKVYGLVEAEEYFENISDTASRKAAFFPLLRGYVKEREVEKAEALMVKLSDWGLIVSVHPYNEMMKLYNATSQFGKVRLVIEQLKRNQVPLDFLSYNLWMNSCEETSGVSSVEMVFKEMLRDGNVEVGWSSLATLANIYGKAGEFDKANWALKSAEKKLNCSNRLGYMFLMTQHASLKNKEEVLRLWEASKAVGGRVTCANYIRVLGCLVKLGDLVEAERLFKEWESNRGKYDVRVSNVLLGAYVRNGLMDKAEALHLHTMESGGCPNYKTWEILMEGWLKSGNMEKAIDAMKIGFSMLKHCDWRPSNGILMTIVDYFEKQGNVEEARWFIETIHDLGFANLSLYKSLLRIHLSAKRPAFDIISMMEKDKVEMDEEANALESLVRAA
ncbi:hypothetical protein UlMin_034771 [Ulmus minor]